MHRADEPFVRSRAPRRFAARAAIACCLTSAALATSCALSRPVPLPMTATRMVPALATSDVRFPSASGSLIHGVFAPGRARRGAVLLLHGVGSSHAAMLARAGFLHDAGFTVLLPDFQAHGASPGRRPTYGALESLDAAAAVEFLRAHACGERVGVIGVSMGGAASLVGPRPLPVDAMVLESVYPTLREATSARLDTWLGPLGFAGRWATPAALRWIGWRAGVSDSALRPIDRIAAVRAPLLVASGTDDPYTPLAETLALYERATAPKELWAVARARHEDLHAFAGAEYERRVGDFLVRHLRQPADDATVRAALAHPVAAAAALEAEQRADYGEAAQCLHDGERRGEG